MTSRFGSPASRPAHEAGVRLLGEVLRAAEQHPADAVERVTFPAAVPVGALLGDGWADLGSVTAGEVDGE